MNASVLATIRANWKRVHADQSAYVLSRGETTDARGGRVPAYTRSGSTYACRVNTAVAQDSESAGVATTIQDSQISLEWAAASVVAIGSLVEVVDGNIYEIIAADDERGNPARALYQCRRIDDVRIIES